MTGIVFLSTGIRGIGIVLVLSCDSFFIKYGTARNPAPHVSNHIGSALKSAFSLSSMSPIWSKSIGS